MHEEKSITDLEELSAFWTSVMRDDAAKDADRIRASELRAKAAGAFNGKEKAAAALDSADRELLRKVLQRLQEP